MTTPTRRRAKAHPQRPTPITADLLRRWRLPANDGKLGKDDRGAVFVVGGSSEIPGAVLLAGVAALRAGAGKLQIATARSVATAVAVAVPEARVVALAETRSGEIARGCARAVAKQIARCDALLVGPGMMSTEAARELLRHAVASAARGTLIVDAGALETFAGRTPLARPHAGGVIATPHAGEMASLWGVPRERVLAQPLELAREAARALGIVMVLKGAETFVVGPDGDAYHNTAGNPGLGTSGSGDTLSGVIAGLSARGATPIQAAVWGVHLHAKAGDELARKVSPLGFLARELLNEIPPLLARLGKKR